MAATPKRLSIVKDDVIAVVGAINELSGQQVLVGIPEKTAGRSGDPVNNATIGYVMETGMPSHNVPARPWLVPGVKDGENDEIAALRKAADAALDGNKPGIAQWLNAAGSIAVGFVRLKIGSNIPPPLAPSTIRNRFRARGTKSRRPEEDRYHTLVSAGMPHGQAQDAAGIVSLINSGQLRNAVTYVLRKITGRK